MLRKLICGTLWLLATGVTAAIVYYGMATNSVIVTVLGVIGIISASCGIYIANDGKKQKARGVLFGGLLLWFLGEAFVIPAEINFWEATVTAKAERELDYQRQADGRRLILDNTAEQLKSSAPTRPMGEIQADINAALAKTYSKKTLASTTANCSDLSSPFIKFCKDVFALQKELAGAQDKNTKSTLVWEANQSLSINTSEAHGAHDGPAALAAIFGGTVLFWRHVMLGIMIALLWVNRGFGLAMASAKSAPKPVLETKPAAREPASEAVSLEPIAASETQVAHTEPAFETTAPEPEHAFETEAALDPGPAEIEPETEIESVADSEPVKGKRSKKSKSWTKLSDYVPETRSLEDIDDPEQAEYVRHVREIDAGRSMSPSQGRTKMNRVRKANGLSTVSQGAYSKRLKATGRDLGVVIDAPMGRQYTSTAYVANAGRKANSVLGSAAIPA